ncbi:MAG: glycosyltransferase [Pseudomonadales bacterium]|nr:glycosyltransferase [Pseudomonadales bacterium]
MEFLFWFLISICIYGYIGYPLLLAIITPYFSRYQQLPQSISTGPSVSVLVAAYNEEKNIAIKIDSLLSQTYPSSDFDIWVLDDGSDDRTAEIVKNYDDQRVNLLSLPRGGKATALNAGVASSTKEIIVFSDADNEWTENTLMRLISPFSLLSVGAVSGHLSIRKNSKHLGIGDRLYRQYEAFIRKCETKLGNAVSADGGIFAIRRVLYQDLPQDVTDDFYISTGAIINGQSLVYQETAVAYDDGVDNAGNQLRRRIRVTVRGMTSLWRRRELFNIFRYGVYSFCLFSHKLIRRFVPFFAILLLPVNIFVLHNGGFYIALFSLQIGFYLCAVAGLIDNGRRLPKSFSMAGFVLLSSFGLASGIVQFLLGKRFTFWSPEENR